MFHAGSFRILRCCSLFLGLAANGYFLCADANPRTEVCAAILAHVKRLTDGANALARPRLTAFLEGAFSRYANDPHAQALAKKVETASEIEIESALPELKGKIAITREGETLAVNIPLVQLLEATEKVPMGRSAKTLDTHFVKFMSGLILGVGRIVEKNPSIRTVKIEALIANERLAQLLHDFGFGNSPFSRPFTPEEIHHIYTKNRFPPRSTGRSSACGRRRVKSSPCAKRRIGRKK